MTVQRVVVVWDAMRHQYAIINAISGMRLAHRVTFSAAADVALRWQERVCSSCGSFADHPSRLDASGRCDECRP
jgi:ribosomal protein S27AE